MTTRITLVLIALLAFAACKTEKKEETKRYTLGPDDMNIYVEKFDSTEVDINKYNVNNKVYKVGSSFLYKFKHIDTSGVAYNFDINSNNGRIWDFTPQAELTPSSTTTVTLTVLNGNPMGDRIPDYNQTNIKYQLNGHNSYSRTGVIENEKNVWLHPPRQSYFRILELNPFPFIKAPYEVGNSWNWSLNIGSAWGDERWKTWEGSITNTYNYEITNYQTIDTDLGSLECYVIESKALSPIGVTYLKAYFNTTYGFVILDYTNIDGSKTKLELIEYYIPESE